MLQILKEYIDRDMLVREYTKDGENVSHIVKTPIQHETDGEIIELPPNPLLQLQQENDELKARIEIMQQALDDLILGGV
ncbi:hypothetical protein [Anoxybacteroides rupiense]|uniref:hypothetical protein n=1 Tax=Anoxybacteroides rupiense TaxID=311460 RepID=UPI001F09803F|nr:hypothetical protein [Anoxybacillus rupiensis]